MDCDPSIEPAHMSAADDAKLYTCPPCMNREPPDIIAGVPPTAVPPVVVMDPDLDGMADTVASPAEQQPKFQSIENFGIFKQTNGKGPGYVAVMALV